jgi:hypothetical protein
VDVEKTGRLDMLSISCTEQFRKVENQIDRPEEAAASARLVGN